MPLEMESVPEVSCWCHVEPQRVVAWWNVDRGVFEWSGCEGEPGVFEEPMKPQPTSWSIYRGRKE